MKYRLLILLAMPLILNGCSGTKETLGLTKKSPDEFAVIKRAPLSMPPDYRLRPPTPGATRPQEQTTDEMARVAVFGQQNNDSYTPTSADEEFLKRAGTYIADPDIRSKIDAEKEQFEQDNRPIGQKIFGIGSSESDTVVDAKGETIRILENKEKGAPITLGETPMK